MHETLVGKLLRWRGDFERTDLLNEKSAAAFDRARHHGDGAICAHDAGPTEDRVGRQTWRDGSLLFGVALVVSASPAALAVDLQLPSDVHGAYAIGGDCTKQPRITVDEAGVHLDTADGLRAALPVAVSYTAVGGMSYDGIQIWAWVKHGGKDRWGDDLQPVVLTFNAGEQQGVLSAERPDPGDEPPVTLDGPLLSIVQAADFRLCPVD